MKIIHRIACILCIAALGGCTMGPNYARPDAEVPATWKELPPHKTATPADTASRGAWWEVFGDPVLNDLEARVAAANQTLRAAEANHRQAQAAITVARAGLFPSAGGSVDATRARARGGGGGAATVLTADLTGQWEIDLWGRVRRLVEAAQDTAQATQADLENTRLALQAELASDYLLLRVADAGKRVLQDTVAAYERSLVLTQNRYAAGVAARTDVVAAETQLLGARASLIDIDATRAQLEHAIADLAGQPPAQFSIAVADTVPPVPDIPATVPSAVLERRPDVAAAERRVAAANAQVGVATAAIYPTLSLNGTIGFAGSSLADWLSLPNRVWSLGAAFAGTIFDAGALQAQRTGAVAAYDATVASYRQTVLDAFRDVEDNLALLRILGEEARVQDETVRAARESVALTLNQYKAGIVGYLNVVTVQAVQFNAERTQIQLNGQRLTAAVNLVKALGGGFDAAQLQAAAQ
jgi:NodT family efflux transporter outer membrane factor (OMF) lipoprotein